MPCRSPAFRIAEPASIHPEFLGEQKERSQGVLRSIAFVISEWRVHLSLPNTKVPLPRRKYPLGEPIPKLRGGVSSTTGSTNCEDTLTYYLTGFQVNSGNDFTNLLLIITVS